MDTLEFFASLVSSLAWPLTVVALIAIMKEPISSAMAGDLKRWRAGPSGVEFEYWERKSSTVREALQHTSPVGAGVSDRVEEVHELEEVARVAPVAAVLDAFSRVESELQSRLEAVTPGSTDRLAGTRLARQAMESGVINQETLNAIEGLSVLRNLAAHGRADTDLDTQRALEFVHLADAVLYSIRASGPAG